jgi:hypothetical protein
VPSPISLSFLAAPLASGSAWVTPTIVISIVALAVSLWTFFLSGRRARLDRQRQVFADAFEAVMEYREYPFIVRRRNKDDLVNERQRISSDLSKVQAKLNAFKARLLVEDPAIGQGYAELVKKTRQIAGAMIKAAWDNPPVAGDEEMHAPPYDFSELVEPDNAYLQAVADHLHWMPGRGKLRERKKEPGATPAAPIKAALPKAPEGGDAGTGS